MSQLRRRITPLTAQLDREWEQHYSRECIDLGALGSGTGDEWMTLMRTGSADRQDAVLRTLLEHAAQGSPEAERVLLAMMMPKVIAFSRTTVRSVAGADAVAVAIGAAWEVIRTFRVTPGMHHVRGSLVLAILRTILAAEPPAREIPFDPVLLPQPLESPTLEWIDPGARVEAVLEWAVTAGVLDPDQARLIVRIDVLGEGYREIASEMSVDYDTLRKRAFRARCKLTAAVRNQLSDPHARPSASRRDRLAASAVFGKRDVAYP